MLRNIFASIKSAGTSVWQKEPRRADTAGTNLSPPQAVQFGGAFFEHTRESYCNYIDRYVSDIEAYYRALGKTVLDARQRLETTIAQREKSHNMYFCEYLQTFIPFVFIFTLFLREQINRDCAEKTHLVLRECADKRSSLKRVVL